MDFLGVPGIGKSTLYKELFKYRISKEHLVTPFEARIKVAQFDSKKSASSLKDLILHEFLKSGIFSQIHYPLSKRILNRKYAVLTLWGDDERDALDVVIRKISNSAFPPNLKLLRYAWLLEIGRNISLLEKFPKANIDKLILFDESLTQKMINLGPWKSEDDKRQLDLLYKLLGDLYAAVFLDTDSKNIIERLEQRKNRRLTHAHAEMNECELLIETEKRVDSARQLADMLETKGIKIIRIDASFSIKEQAQAVRKALF